MNETLTELLAATPAYHHLRNWAVRRRQTTEFACWEQAGRPLPVPHLLKQRVLREHAQRYGLKILVETGTYYGDMVQAMRPYFEKIYSIELSAALHERARRRFRGVDRIELLRGDSGVELGRLMPGIDRPALFWLDGHYSAGITAKGEKETPIFEELGHVFAAPDIGHVIVIDDARCFGTDPAYPTMGDLTAFVRANRPDHDITIDGDSIRIVPRSTLAVGQPTSAVAPGR